MKTGRMITARGTLPDLLTSMLTIAGCKLDQPFSRGTQLFPDLG